MSTQALENSRTVGMIGLGRMGGNLVRRLLRSGHDCVVWDRDTSVGGDLASEGATFASDLADLVAKLPTPRIVWLMVPAAVTASVANEVGALLEPGDILLDGGNSHYRDSIDRAGGLFERGVYHVDVGTSGGVHGLSRGYCLMIGGDSQAVSHLIPVFEALAPGASDVPRTPGRSGDFAQEEKGYLHCGPPGAGHFVKMVHNAIEYGLMAAYGEGLNVLRHAGMGFEARSKDAETAPLRDAKYYQFDFQLDQVSELWRRGSVIPSWLLDLTAEALFRSPQLEEFEGKVSDSGEGRWAQMAAIDEGVPTHVLSAALFDRFASRGRAEFASRVLSAMRLGFGGHHEKKG